MKNTFLIILIHLLSTVLFAQDSELVYENNEFKISHIEFDSIYSIFKVERYHDESHHFGAIEIIGDTVFFHENIDTFFIVEPKVFYDFDINLSANEIKLESRISFWEAPEWKSWLNDINYIINDTVSHFCPYLFEDNKEYHELIIPMDNSHFDLSISTKELFRSKELHIDLKPTEYFYNFQQVDPKLPLYNRVVIKYRIVGTSPLPGTYFKNFAPDKIKLNNTEYFFRVDMPPYH